eukprot:TRINITY_DN45366_c0_g1_i1.p1 TRINITY_DN45366_c0_g1~~TRINITY_DN45366_c0_g1_i1.p1  ORF type:complete len:197 (-),score=14.98 TRINITY_DN45366_c0_g1_i1:127-687(-)
MTQRLPILPPEIRPLVGADCDTGRRRHVFRASMAGKGPAQPEGVCPVHFYARSLDTLGSGPGAGPLARGPQQSSITRSASAHMGTAQTGRGEFPVPVAGLSPARSPSMFNLRAMASQQQLASIKPQPFGRRPKLPPRGGTSLPQIHTAAVGHWQILQRQHLQMQRQERCYTVRLPHWPKGVRKKGY